MTLAYDEAQALEICVRMVEGETLKEICTDSELPSLRTVYRWLAKEPTFWHAYARAREAQTDRMADEIVEIADDAANDYTERVGRDGEVERVLDPENVQRSRLRIDTRKWLMSKFAARRFGDKVQLEMTGGDEPADMTDEQLEARTRAILAKINATVPDGPLLLGLPAPPAPGADDAGNE
tara:strand:+ start:78 stop:617 length:540 start_codon:yes stop_codon:yes gene_type:complete